MRGYARNLTRRIEVQLIDALDAQIAATADGGSVTLLAVRGELDSAEARRRMTDIEHRGDAERARVIAVLSRSLAPPIDREDLFRASRSVDDVLDNLRDFVREYDLFGGGPQPLLVEVVEAVVTAIASLRETVAVVSEDPRRISAVALTARKNEIRPRYQLAMAELLCGEVTPEMLRRRELLRRLDVVGLRLGEAADALADGAVKRSH